MVQPHSHRDRRDQPPPAPQPRTYFVTTLILTPKTPVCFLDGVLFRLMSLLVNFMENSTLICRTQEVTPSSPALPRHLRIAQKHSTAPGKGLQPKRGAVCPCGPAYPVHLNHIHVPVLRLHGLRVQLRGEMVRELRGDATPCQPCCCPAWRPPKPPNPQTVWGTGHALPWHCAAHARRMEREGLGSLWPCPEARWAQPPHPGPPRVPARQCFNPHPRSKKFPRN